MSRLYITKWVLARGILVAEGEIEDPIPRAQKKRVYARLPGARFAGPLFLGSEVFLTLKEARADAAERFRVALRNAKTQLAYLEAAHTKLDELLVHKPGKLVGRCHAFKNIGVHSSAGWIVDPARLGREKGSRS